MVSLEAKFLEYPHNEKGFEFEVSFLKSLNAWMVIISLSLRLMLYVSLFVVASLVVDKEFFL